MAANSSQVLERIQISKSPIELRVTMEHEEKLKIPAPVFDMLKTILKEMAAGHSIQLIPQQAELTTQQAADLLNVSRPYLVGLLEAKAIPFRTVGKHRRMLAKDVLKYKQDTFNEQTKTLDKMAEETQALGIDYF